MVPHMSPYSPNPRGKPLSDATLSQLFKELGIAAVPHGFRASFLALCAAWIPVQFPRLVR